MTLTHESETEARTRDQLLRLVRTYDVTRYVRTTDVVIDQDCIPHSHPVLTLHTRHLDDDALLLSTLIHEQTHWWLEAERDRTDATLVELRARFPGLPVGYPDGADTEIGSYEHLIVDHVEMAAVRRLLGDAEARRVLDFWRADHYRVLYELERTNGTEIGEILERHGLTT